MKVIVDTNIVFSAIISPKGLQRDTLIKPSKRIKFYSLYYLREEIIEHLPRLQQISGLSLKEVMESYELVTQHILFFAEDLIPLNTWMQAYDVMKNIDMDDIPFAAAAIHLKALLWTGDKKISTFKKKKLPFKTISTAELKIQ